MNKPPGRVTQTGTPRVDVARHARCAGGLSLVSRHLLPPLAIALLVVLAVLIGGIWFYRDQEQSMRKAVENQLASIAHLKVDEITTWRAERLADAAVLAESPFLAQAVARFMVNPRPEAAEELLGSFRSLQNHFHYADVLLVDPEGHVRLRLTEHLNGHQPDTTALLAALRDRKPVFVDLQTCKTDGKHNFSVIAPLFAGIGQAPTPLGAIILVSDASKFLYPLIESWPTPTKTAETTLSRRDGNDVLFLNDLRHRPGTALKLRIPLSATEVPAVMAVLGREGIVQGKDYRGVDVVSALQPIPDSPWFMVAKVDIAEAFAVWQFRSGLILALLMSMVVMAGALGFMLWHRSEKVYYRAACHSAKALRESEERLSATLRSIGDGVIACDAKGNVASLNVVAETLTGWSADEARGLPITEVFRIIHAETRQEAEIPVGCALREDRIIALANHTALIARDGTERQIADSCAPIHDATGGVIGAVLVFRDVTKEYRQREQLRERETRFNQLAEQSRTITWELDTQGLYTYVSDVSEAVLGYCPDELVGRMHFYDLRPESEREAFKRKEPFQNFVNAAQTKEGRQVWLSTNGVPLLNADGTLRGYRGSDTDITEQKRADEAVRQERDFSRNALDSMPGLFYLFDDQGRFLRWNKNFELVSGYTAEELRRMSPLDLFEKPDKTGVAEAIRQVFRGGKAIIVEGGFLSKDKTRTSIVFTGNLIQFENKCCLVGMGIDITKRKRAEDALRESETRMRAITDSAQDAILMMDPRGRISYWNPAAERILGYTHDEAIGQALHNFIVPQRYHEAHHAAFPGFLRSGRGAAVGQTLELEARRKDGREITVALSLSAIQLDGGWHAVGILRDITERKQVETALRESEERFMGVLYASSDAILLIGDNMFVDCNEATARMLGYATRAEFLQTHPSKLSPPEQPDGRSSFEKAEEMMRLAFERGFHRFEWMHRRANNEDFPVEVSLTPIVHEGKDRLYCVWRDITERKKAEDNLRKVMNNLEETNWQLADATAKANEMAAQAELANCAKSEFLANMSHEIRTPMTAILGYADLLGEGCPGQCTYGSGELREGLGTIQRNGKHLLALINDILDLSKIEAEKMTTEQVVCSPHQVVAEVASLVRVRATDKGLQFNTEFIGSVPDTVQTDPLRLRQILINIIGNAIKFTNTGGVRLLVRLVTDNGEPRIQFDVIDTGIGMTPEQAARMFQPFSQADNSTTRQFGGTGLGLAISKRLAQLLGGDVLLVETQPDLGTRFRATVAAGSLDGVRMIEAGSNEEEVSVQHQSVQSSSPSAQTKPLDGLRMLLVEDCPDNQPLIAHLLKKAGANVELADNGRIGLDKALAASHAGQAFDVILMDMQMPEMDGYEATERLRAADYHGPIIALTAHAMEQDHQKCLDAGCDDFATKPIDRDRLLETVRRHACGNYATDVPRNPVPASPERLTANS